MSVKNLSVQNRIYDRRQSDVPVEQDRRCVVEKPVKHGLFSYAMEAVPTFRRLSSVSDKINDGNTYDTASALGMAGLAFINLPEDLRDTIGAAKQVKALITGKEFKAAYDYKNYQHPFSFFRGTLLHNAVHPEKTKIPKIADKLLEMDKTLADTKFGNIMMDLMKVEENDIIQTTIKDVDFTESNPTFLNAVKFKGEGKLAKFGELTARAMKRTTILGLVALSALELPKIIEKFNTGETVGEKAENGAKQILKAGINVASITAGIGYLGALGAKKFGSTGSIVGMGLGAILGSFVSQKIQNSMD